MTITAATSTLQPAVIEYVAQAIREVVANRSGRGRAWSDLPESLRDEYREEARAAIKAYLHARSAP